jgi:hypothetical protein
MLLVGSIADKIALYSLEHKVNFVLNICLSHWPNFGLICLFLSVEKMVSNEQFPNPVLSTSIKDIWVLLVGTCSSFPIAPKKLIHTSIGGKFVCFSSAKECVLKFLIVVADF